MVSPFKGMGATDPRRDSDWIKPGRYYAVVDSFTFGETRKSRGYALFKFTIAHVIDDSEGVKVAGGSHKPSDKASWMLMADNDASAPALKGAMMAITGCESEELDDDAFEKLASTAQPLAGLFVELDARMIKTKNGGDFTLVTLKRQVELDELKEHASESVLKSIGIKVA